MAQPKADYDGASMFGNLFAKYETNPGNKKDEIKKQEYIVLTFIKINEICNYIGFQELPGDLPYSELHFFTPYQDIQYQGTPKTFAWLTGEYL